MSEPQRTCGRCGEEKPLDDFAWRRKERGQRDNLCRPCRSEYGKEHYRANRAAYIAGEARRRRAKADKRFRYLIEYFKTHPCVDCGETDPLVLEFDHLGEKNFNISQGIWNNSWPAILAEIEICDVVCANCHRRRTARRRKSTRAVLIDLMQQKDGALNLEPIIDVLARARCNWLHPTLPRSRSQFDSGRPLVGTVG